MTGIVAEPVRLVKITRDRSAVSARSSISRLEVDDIARYLPSLNTPDVVRD